MESEANSGNVALSVMALLITISMCTRIWASFSKLDMNGLMCKLFNYTTGIHTNSHQFTLISVATMDIVTSRKVIVTSWFQWLKTIGDFAPNVLFICQ